VTQSLLLFIYRMCVGFMMAWVYVMSLVSGYIISTLTILTMDEKTSLVNALAIFTIGAYGYILSGILMFDFFKGGKPDVQVK
jgi:hypothetical protein